MKLIKKIEIESNARWDNVRLKRVLLLGLKPLVLEIFFLKWNGGKAEILSDFVAHSIIYLKPFHQKKYRKIPWYESYR